MNNTLDKKVENSRINFASTKNQLEYPDFLDIQIKSFQSYFQLDTTPENRASEGLFKVFSENFPITDARNQFVLEFLDYFIDPPRYAIEECIERGLTYSVPLKAKLKLYCTDPEHEDFETIVQDVYLGTIPYMTPKGTLTVQKELSYRNYIVHQVFSLVKASMLMVLNYILQELSLLEVLG